MEGSYSGSKESMPVSHQNTQSSKKIELYISMFLSSSVLCWYLLNQSSIFVTASIINLQFFVDFDRGLYSFLHAVIEHYLWLADNGLSMLPEMPTWFFPPTPPMHPQDTYIKEKIFASALLYRHRTSQPG